MVDPYAVHRGGIVAEGVGLCGLVVALWYLLCALGLSDLHDAGEGSSIFAALSVTVLAGVSMLLREPGVHLPPRLLLLQNNLFFSNSLPFLLILLHL